MSRLKRECMICNNYIESVVHSCFIPVEKNDRLELTGCKECLKVIVEKWDGKKRSYEETKRLIGLEV
ncbi:hypothetical protein CHH83_01765 [Bacillus sp. 7586-K]|nr:hypothetical protein CHH83_01765 [Bacillus sp. 7586-K]